jgi:3D (Asp-Asp-Asp) domain-containing protein
MKQSKPIMRAYVPISREGRFLLSIIILLLFVVLVGITFVLMAQEAQGKMLDQHIQATANASEEFVDTEIAADTESADLIGTFKTTFYCAGFGPGCPVCGTNGITSTGTKCSPLGNDWVTIAVDPRVIPYGTKLKIEMGNEVIYGIAEDTGGFAQGLHPVEQIDICCANHEEALAMGVEQVKIYNLIGD